MLSQVPLTLLRAFEAAGRTGSFRSAARELNLTASAVSHAIRKLEQQLGANLFLRSAARTKLSPEGEALLLHVSRGFADIRSGLELISTRGPTMLRLHCAPSFAAQWLSPRLAGFLGEHPSIDVRIAANTDYARFDSFEFDADIVYGRPKLEGVVVLPLGEEVVAPMCAPQLAPGIRSVADLERHNLIQSDNKQVRWPAWFDANGHSSPVPQGSRFDRSFMAIAAAVAGLGVTLESTRLAERELDKGTLVMPLAACSRNVTYVGHYLVFSKAMRHRQTIRLFRDWLLTELSLPLPDESLSASDRA